MCRRFSLVLLLACMGSGFAAEEAKDQERGCGHSARLMQELKALVKARREDRSTTTAMERTEQVVHQGDGELQREVDLHVESSTGLERRVQVHDRREGHDDGSSDRVIRTHTQVRRPDEQTVNRQRVDRIQEQRTGDGATWHRETEVHDNRGHRRNETADGERHVAEDRASGGASRSYEGTHSDRQTDRTVDYEGEDSRAWQQNELGGRDTVESRHREDSEGRFVDATTERRSRPTGDGHAYKEATTRTTRDGTAQLYKEGRKSRTVTDTGYIDYLIEKGLDAERKQWTREVRETVVYDGDSRRVQHCTALQQGGAILWEIREGTYTRLPNGQGWRYVGTVTKKRGSKVTETQDVERTCRYLHIPEKKPAKEDADEARGKMLDEARELRRRRAGEVD